MLCNTDLLKNFEGFCIEYQCSEKIRGLFLSSDVNIPWQTQVWIAYQLGCFVPESIQCNFIYKCFALVGGFIHLYQILFQSASFVCFHQ